MMMMMMMIRYANRAKNIKNKPKINEDPKDAMLREYQEQVCDDDDDDDDDDDVMHTIHYTSLHCGPPSCM